MTWSKIIRERCFEGREEERELTILDFAIGWIKERAYVFQYINLDVFNTTFAIEYSFNARLLALNVVCVQK